jgi:hypothetical protein
MYGAPFLFSDRFIRDEQHFVRAVEYIEMNPVVAGPMPPPGRLALRQRTLPAERELPARTKKKCGEDDALPDGAARMAGLPKVAALAAALCDRKPAGKP